MGRGPERNYSIDYGDAMMSGLSVRTVVVETSVFEVSIDRSDAPHAMSVELTRDGIRVRAGRSRGGAILGSAFLVDGSTGGPPAAWW